MEKVKREGSYLFEMVKALIVSLIITLVLVLLEALAAYLFNLEDGVIKIVNQVIKGVAVLITALVVLRLPKNGWLRGLIFGLLYAVLTYVVFSLLDNNFKTGLSVLNDVAFSAAAGFVSGILASVIRK